MDITVSVNDLANMVKSLQKENAKTVRLSFCEEIESGYVDENNVEEMIPASISFFVSDQNIPNAEIDMGDIEAVE